MANKLKIFEIQYAGEYNWIAAYSLIGALKFYCKETGVKLEDFDDNDNIGTLKEEVYSEYTVMPEKGTGQRKKSFATALKQLKEPDWISTTEYN